MVGNEGKTKICLNLVKSFCGAGAEYDEIENEVKRIKPNPKTKEIEGKMCIKLNSIVQCIIDIQFGFI